MEITLRRKQSTETCTHGDMFIDGVWECFTLEDVVRAEGVKIHGKTAIPSGVYNIIIDYSTRFKRAMPHILDVPYFEGIRIHAGNTSADTEGCIIVASSRPDQTRDFVANSRVAYNTLFDKISAAAKVGERITIKIIDSDPSLEARREL